MSDAQKPNLKSAIKFFLKYDYEKLKKSLEELAEWKGDKKNRKTKRQKRGYITESNGLNKSRERI